MTKRTKTGLIVSAIFIAFGLCLVVGTAIAGVRPHNVRHLLASAQSDFPYGKESIVSEEHLTYPSKEVKELDIDIDVAQVFISIGEDFTVRAENTEEMYIKSVLEKDGTLEIKDERYKEWFERSPINHPKVYITIPEGLRFNSVDIETDVGVVEAKNISFVTKKLDVKTEVGSIELVGVTSSETEADVAVGSINLKGTFTGNTELSCAIGSIMLTSTGDINDWSYEAKTTLGSIKINENKMAGLAEQSSFSNKKNHFDLSCDLGSIEVTIAN